MKSLPLFAALLLTFAGCASRPAANPVEDYLAAEKATPGVVLTSSQEAAAIARFKTFFGNVTEEAVRTQIRDLYAPDAWFNDTLKTVRGVPAIEDYFTKVAKSTDLVSATVLDVARSGDNYYIRWVMDVRFQNSKTTIRTIGMTQVRYDAQGRIVFHQDFWDSTAGFFEHVPVLGAGIRWIKSLL